MRKIEGVLVSHQGYATWCVSVCVCVCKCFFWGISRVLLSFGGFLPIGDQK
jgi:hypothetical protein